MTVSAASGEATLGAQLKLGNYKSSADQKYKLFEVGNGIYTIQNSSTGYVVDFMVRVPSRIHSGRLVRE